MKIFLETSLLSDISLAKLSEEIVQRRSSLDEFCVSALTHFQILWGYALARRSTEKYDKFIKSISIEVVPLTKLDSEEASRMKPSKKDLIDALIAATAKRYEALVWTEDSDFLKFLPKDRVRLLK
ncbi:MAG: type II toxin-antitoxin system VapC family toxin [Nitrososphaerales archaeon]